MNITILIALCSAAAAGAAGFGSAWHIQGSRITQMELNHANAIIQQQRAARQSIDRALSQVSQAQNDAQARRVVIAADSRRAGDAGYGLRLTSTSAVRTATDNADACAAIVATYDAILEEGRGFIQEVAGAADQCFSDLKTVNDAWPK